MVGAGGVEPPTSRFQSEDSGQTELYTVLVSPDRIELPSSGCKPDALAVRLRGFWCAEKDLNLRFPHYLENGEGAPLITYTYITTAISTKERII